VGVAVSAGSRLLGIEVFGDHATFLEHRARVLRSFVHSALASSPDGNRLDGPPPSRESVIGVLTSAPRAAFHDEPPLGAGKLSVFCGVGREVFGYGLLEGSQAVHAVMFTSVPAVPDAVGSRGGMQPGDRGGVTGGGEAPRGGGAERTGPPSGAPDAK
jgi:hypothetical protein